MCAVLVGDVKWLRLSFGEGGESEGLSYTCLSGEEGGLDQIVSGSDLVVLMTDQLPHAVRRRVCTIAATGNVPVCMRHSSAASVLRYDLRSVAA